jgi:hypothetical protein
VNKEKIKLGYYNTFEEVVEVREQAEIKYYGEYKYQGGDKI